MVDQCSCSSSLALMTWSGRVSVENTGEEERAIIFFCQAYASGISKSVG